MTATNFPPLRILAVCTGNVCRSPAVERLLRAELDDSVTVVSAGTHALVGEPIAAPMADLVSEAGADSTGFAASQLTEADVRGADLILALTRDHRAEVVDLWPGAVRRSFTLTEFARALLQIDSVDLPAAAHAADRITTVLPQAATLRGQHQPTAPGEDDIIDPYRRSAEIYQQAFDQISESVAIIADMARVR